MRRIARFRPGALAALLVLGCGEAPTLAPSGPGGAAVTITPARVVTTAGVPYPLQVQAHDADGTAIPAHLLLWTTSDPKVAYATNDGVVEAQGPGAAEISAQYGRASATAAVTVLAAKVTAVAIDPATVAVAVGETRSATARATDASGGVVSGVPVGWSSDNASVASVDNGGVVRGIHAGTTHIHATVEEVVGTAEVDVAPSVDDRVATVRVTPMGANLTVGETRQFAAIPLNAAGTALSGLGVAWSVQDGGVASVASDGTVTGAADGITRIVATISGVAGTAIVNVTSGTVTGAWPHEPPGFTPITDQPWDLLTTLGWAVQYGTASIGVDLGAPVSPPGVLTIAYPVGFGGGSAPGTMTRLIAPTKRIFSGIWWKVSDPWQGHNSNVNKISFLFPESGGDMTMVMYGSPGGPYHLRVIPQFPGFASDWLTPNVEDLPVALGVWHQIEWLVDYGSGTGVGTVQWWMDGRLIGSYDNVPFPNSGMGVYKLSPTWGGVGDTKNELDYYWFDQTYLSSGP